MNLIKVGYLYRTTAVYGSGKFGLADRFRIKDREEIYGPFRLEMMLVYLLDNLLLIKLIMLQK